MFAGTRQQLVSDPFRCAVALLHRRAKPATTPGGVGGGGGIGGGGGGGGTGLLTMGHAPTAYSQLLCITWSG